ncbi:MAG: helix-turn-helix domain-containing protein [Clostridia bacterium]|nr:helix-turn-helix domain-containing protein [Clostridia bacterium]
MDKVQMQYITADIGDMRVMFSGRFPLRTVFADKESHIHSHKHFELHYTMSGSFQLNAGQTTAITLNPGDILLIPPGMLHATSRSIHQRMVFSFSLLKGEKQNRGFSEYQYYNVLLGTVHEPLIFRSTEVDSCMSSLMALYDNEISVHKQQILLSMLFLRLSEHIAALKEPPVDKPTSGSLLSDSDRRWLIENYANSYYMQPNSIDGLCEQLGLCRRQTDRTVQRLFGESYQSLVRKRRMDAAGLLIRHTELPFSEIASELGYESYTGFYLAVRNYFGLTPEVIREQEKSEKETLHENH